MNSILDGVLEEAKKRYTFEGTKRYDCEKLDAFIDGAEFAENIVTSLIIKFKEWCDENEYDIRLNNISIYNPAITTEQLLEQFLKTPQSYTFYMFPSKEVLLIFVNFNQHSL